MQYTQAQIDRANAASLEDFLRTQGETLKMCIRDRRFFPPVVTGPIIIAIGLGLSASAVNNCSANWPLAFIALALVIVFNIWGKGMLKIVPILLGVFGAYIIALIVGNGFGVEGWAIDCSACLLYTSRCV